MGEQSEIQRLTRERDEARAHVRRLTEEERVLTCAFCGQPYPPGTPESNHAALTAHVKVCFNHPMREAERELARLARLAEELCRPDRKQRRAMLFMAIRRFTATDIDDQLAFELRSGRARTQLWETARDYFGHDFLSTEETSNG